MDSKEIDYWTRQAKETAGDIIRDPKKSAKEDIPNTEVIVLIGGTQERTDYFSELLQAEIKKKGREPEIRREIMFSETVSLTSQDGVYPSIKELIDFRTPDILTIVMDPEGLFAKDPHYQSLERRVYSIDMTVLGGEVPGEE